METIERYPNRQCCGLNASIHCNLSVSPNTYSVGPVHVDGGSYNDLMIVKETALVL